MKKLLGLLLFIIQLAVLTLGVFLVIGIMNTDPFPTYLAFWSCGNWSACLTQASIPYVVVSLAVCVVIVWVIKLVQWRKNK